jgi:hypothetical protein
MFIEKINVCKDVYEGGGEKSKGSIPILQNSMHAEWRMFIKINKSIEM